MRKKAWLGWGWDGDGMDGWDVRKKSQGRWALDVRPIENSFETMGSMEKMRFMGRNGETFVQTSKYLGRHLTSLIHHPSSASNEKATPAR